MQGNILVEEECIPRTQVVQGVEGRPLPVGGRTHLVGGWPLPVGSTLLLVWGWPLQVGGMFHFVHLRCA